MAVAISNAIELSGAVDQIFCHENVAKMLGKLAKQELELQNLQQSLLKEKQAKESLQSDFEHVLGQLEYLKYCNVFDQHVVLVG